MEASMTTPRDRSKVRALLKAISWRAVATLTTTSIVFVVTGKLALSVGVGLWELALKTLLYYGHELWWERMR